MNGTHTHTHTLMPLTLRFGKEYILKAHLRSAFASPDVEKPVCQSFPDTLPRCRLLQFTRHLDYMNAAFGSTGTLQYVSMTSSGGVRVARAYTTVQLQ